MELGSDTGQNPIPGSLQINLLFTIYAEHASGLKADAKLCFSSEDMRRAKPVSLNTNRFGGAERDRTADPLLAKQVLSQLSYSPISSIARFPRFGNFPRQVLHSRPRTYASKLCLLGQMVGPGRLELPTPRLSSVCSNQLSYGPILVKPVDAVLCLLEERETWTARLAIPS